MYSVWHDSVIFVCVRACDLSLTTHLKELVCKVLFFLIKDVNGHEAALSMKHLVGGCLIVNSQSTFLHHILIIEFIWGQTQTNHLFAVSRQFGIFENWIKQSKHSCISVKIFPPNWTCFEIIKKRRTGHMLNQTCPLVTCRCLVPPLEGHTSISCVWASAFETSSVSRANRGVQSWTTAFICLYIFCLLFHISNTMKIKEVIKVIVPMCFHLLTSLSHKPKMPTNSSGLQNHLFLYHRKVLLYIISWLHVGFHNLMPSLNLF